MREVDEKCHLVVVKRTNLHRHTMCLDMVEEESNQCLLTETTQMVVW